MRVRMTCLVAVLATVASAIGCGSSPSSPTDALTGTWNGSYTRGSSAGAISMETTQSGAAVIGTWSANGEGLGSPLTGTVAGTVTGTSVALLFTPSTPIVCGPGPVLSGTWSLTATVNGDRLAGDYVVFLCDSAGSGRIEVTRR